MGEVAKNALVNYIVGSLHDHNIRRITDRHEKVFGPVKTEQTSTTIATSANFDDKKDAVDKTMHLFGSDDEDDIVSVSYDMGSGDDDEENSIGSTGNHMDSNDDEDDDEDDEEEAIVSTTKLDKEQDLVLPPPLPGIADDWDYDTHTATPQPPSQHADSLLATETFTHPSTLLGNDAGSSNRIVSPMIIYKHN